MSHGGNGLACHVVVGHARLVGCQRVARHVQVRQDLEDHILLGAIVLLRPNDGGGTAISVPLGGTYYPIDSTGAVVAGNANGVPTAHINSGQGMVLLKNKP